MFRFENPQAFLFLWLIPIMIGAYYLYIRRRRTVLTGVGETSLLKLLIDSWGDQRRHLKNILTISSLLFLIIALANPQWGTKKEKVTAQSSDIFIAIDVSHSMLAEDISPNRLERAKRLCISLVDALKGNRIGLILFAGNAYLQMPLTHDYAAAQMFVNSANTNMAPTQGTAIEEAVLLVEKSYTDDKPAQRALIILTDGEDHDGDALTAVKEAHKNGLFVYTIGVGTAEGAVIPYVAQGQKKVKRDAKGEMITSALNIDMINQLAQVGGGEAWLIGQGAEIIDGIRKRIEQISKREVEQRSFTDYYSYFQYFLALGILLLIAQFFISDKTNSAPSELSV